MPFVYTVDTVAVAENFVTSAAANTLIDHLFAAPKTGAAGTAVRNITVLSLIVGGKGAALTSITGIGYRLKKWTTTASAGGTAIVPAPRDPGAQASLFTAGGASAGVTSGTGGPTLLGGCTSGAAGPGGWVAENPDAAHVIQGNATQSIDLFTSQAGTVAMNFEARLAVQE
jgi:hypothetical protein